MDRMEQREKAPNPRQVLYLWKLLAFDRGLPRGRIKPLKSAAERNELEQWGLIEKAPEPGRGRSGRLVEHMVLSENGWLWVAQNPGAVPAASAEAAPVLGRVLEKIMAFLDRNEDFFLADLMAPLEPPDSTGEVPDDVEEDLRTAYLALTGGEWNRRVRLADLRRTLGRTPRSDLDQKLLEMQGRGGVVLYPLDDPQEIGPEDRSAALMVQGRARHIVYLTGN